MSKKKRLITLYSPEKDRVERIKSGKWIPVIDLISGFNPDEAIVIYQKKHNKNGEVNAVSRKIHEKGFKADFVEIEYENPYGLIEVSAKLYPLVLKYADTRNFDIYIHTVNGTGVMRQVLYKILEETNSYHIISWPDKGAFGGFDIEKLTKEKHYIENFHITEESILKIFSNHNGSLLLTGESGTGKTLFAHNLYKTLKDKKKDLKFVEVNCAQFASNPQLAQSALFGHVRGAFTGADKQRDGYLKEADNGILFLDEIGELDLSTQALLLKAIEEGKFYRLGDSSSVVSSRFSIIAGTNKNLFEEIKNGNFREDLFHRIGLVRYNLKPLREMEKEKWPDIIWAVFRDIKEKEFSDTDYSLPEFTQEAFDVYLSFAISPQAVWRANYRDLRDSLLRLLLLSNSKITTEDVKKEIAELSYRWSQFDNRRDEFYLINKNLSAKEVENLDYIEKIELEEFLNVCVKSKNLAEAGRILFSSKKDANYSDLVKKYLDKYGLNFRELKK